MNHLSRAQFQQACISFAKRHEAVIVGDSVSIGDSVLKGWKWIPHQLVGYGYLSRTRVLPSDSPLVFDDLEEDLEVANQEHDTTICSTSSDLSNTTTLNEYVVYSATYRVPAFCFRAYDSGKQIRSYGEPAVNVDRLAGGSPLNLDRIVLLGILNSQSSTLLQGSDWMPSLAQQDHPTLSTPCWYLHPCTVTQPVIEMLQERNGSGTTTDLSAGEIIDQWIDTWFVIITSAIRLDVGAVEV